MQMFYEMEYLAEYLLENYQKTTLNLKGSQNCLMYPKEN